MYKCIFTCVIYLYQREAVPSLNAYVDRLILAPIIIEIDTLDISYTICTLLTGCLLEPRLCCEITSRDVLCSYIIKSNLFIVLLIEYVSSIQSSMPIT